MMTHKAVVTSADFFTGERPDNTPLLYCGAGSPATGVQVSSSSTAASQTASSQLHNIATAPELDHDTDHLELPPDVMYRPRSNSAPSILYQQVALELRGISDEFNRQYSRDEVQRLFIISTDEVMFSSALRS